MNKNNWGGYTLALAALAVASSAYADARRDFYFQTATARYFDQAQNARTFGMGGASILTSKDSSSVIGNPAGIGMMKDADLSVTYGFNNISGREHPSYAKIEDEQNLGQVALAVPVGPYLNALPEYGNFGISWTGYESDYKHDSFNGQTDGYRVTGAYGIALSDVTSVGYSLAYFNDSLETDIFDYPSSESFRHTVGVLTDLGDGVSVGANAFIGHGKRKADIYGVSQTESDTFEVGVDVGSSFVVAPGTTLSVATGYARYDTDGEVESGPAAAWVGGDEEGDVLHVRAGVEQALTENVYLRAGYRYGGLLDYDFKRPELADLNGSAKFNAWSTGLGVVIPVGGSYFQSVNLDYGVEYRHVGYHDWQHLVTLSAPFSLCDKKERKSWNYLRAYSQIL